MAYEKGGRHYSFAKYLQRSSYEPVVFCCNINHFSNAEPFYQFEGLWEEHISEEINTPFVYVKSRKYSSNGMQRVMNMVDFYYNVKTAAKEYSAEHGKPDVILASSVHPLTLVAGIQLAKKFGIKCVCEIRDLWPESLVAYNVTHKKNLIVKGLYQLEKWIYKKADALIFTMEGGKDYIIEKGWDKNQGGPIDINKVFHINNGVDLEVFNYNKEHYQIHDNDLTNQDIFKVVYTGSIRKVNNVGLLLDVAKLIGDSTIKILIWGIGDEFDQLQQRVKDENIKNIVFKGKVNKEYVPYIVSMADLNLLHSSASPVLNFGLSANKLFDYFAAEKPILCDFSCHYNPMIQYKAGIIPQGFSTKEIANAIEIVKKVPKTEYDKFCEKAKEGAEEYDFKILTSKLLSIFKNMC